MLQNGRVLPDNTLILDAYTIEIGLEHKHSQTHRHAHAKTHVQSKSLNFHKCYEMTDRYSDKNGGKYATIGIVEQGQHL